jgi:preprotein translocase subunit SecG
MGGGGGGGGGGFLSSRGTANVLTRATAVLAAIFFTTSLILSILAGIERKPRSILGGSTPDGPAAPAVPGAPLGGTGGGVLDQLRGGTPQPQAPTGPQVPRSQ